MAKTIKQKTDDGMAGFESAVAELEDILRQMSGDEATLQQSVELYARAAGLIARCNSGLQAAKVRIDEINLDMGQLLQGGADAQDGL